jgi:surface polysaccharide O-acyltransferase-like enzyme
MAITTNLVLKNRAAPKNISTSTLFDIEATNASKGVALLLLLWHHLFCQNPEYGLYTYRIALMSKACIPIFLILSGYGLAASIKGKKTGLLTFYKNHLSKLYLNYWFVAALFVSFGILFMDYPLSRAYEGNEYIKFLIQMTGLHRWFYQEYGYNPTWWYLSAIIPLYFLFPLIFKLTRKFGAVCFLCLFLGEIVIPEKIYFSEFGEYANFVLWGAAFSFGTFLSLSNGFCAASSLMKRLGIPRFVVLAFLIAGLSSLVEFKLIYFIKSLWLLGSLIILLTFEVIQVSRLAEKVLSFLGKHLFNIFLFHTFIFHFFWKEQIYSFKYPLLIYTALLSTCLIISVLIEILKKAVYFNRLESMILGIKIDEKIFI